MSVCVWIERLSIFAQFGQARICAELGWKANKKFQSNQKLIVPALSFTLSLSLSLSLCCSSVCHLALTGNYIFMVLLWLLQIAKAKRLRTHCHLTWHSIAVKLPPNTKPATSVAGRWRRRGRTKTTTMRGPRTRTTISMPNAFATPRKVFLKKILFFEARHFYVYSSGPPLPRPPLTHIDTCYK